MAGGTRDSEERNRQVGHTETRTWLSRRKHKAGCLGGQVTSQESRDSYEESFLFLPVKLFPPQQDENPSRPFLCLLPQGLSTARLCRHSSWHAPAAGMLTSPPLLSSAACWGLSLRVPRIVGFWLEPASGRHPQKSTGQGKEAKFLLRSLTPHGFGSFPVVLASSLYFPSPLLILLLYEP